MTQSTNTAHNNVISLLEKRSSSSEVLDEARRTFASQAQTIADLAARLDESYTRAVRILEETDGHVIVSGIGKSGIIGKKIAATFASTGTPSFFLHPAEAFHGDLGMITAHDAVILISNSGETEEIVRLIPFIRRLDVPIIAMTGCSTSTLANYADVVLNIAVRREACPNNLAPTNSTLATLAMGDALAVSLIQARNFQPHDFAKFHPGGSLGRKLLTTVRDVMHTEPLPVVPPTMTVQDALITITEGRLGLALVMEGDSLLGIVTDGDLRRGLQRHRDLFELPITAIMTSNPKTIFEGARLSDAEEIMRSHKIKALVVLDNSGKVSGVVEIFDD